jgi:hypothetical protein
VIVVLPCILGHPPKPLHPLHKYGNEDFSVEFTEYLTYYALEGLPVPQMDALELPFEKTKKEEIARGELWAITWLRYPQGFCAFSTIIGLARIVRTCTVQMDQ